MMVTIETMKKRKKPPTFQHYPIEIAKKKKKTWIDTEKLKSKWRAEKRKGGLVGVLSASQPEPSLEQKEGDDEHEDKTEIHSDGPREETRSAPVPTPLKHAPLRTDRKRRRDLSEDKKEDSLRDLTKEAYSRASLHSFKADPLGRNKGRGGGVQKGGRGGIGRWGPPGAAGMGRGQPNMKLRMGAMLEKIKRDFA